MAVDHSRDGGVHGGSHPVLSFSFDHRTSDGSYSNGYRFWFHVYAGRKKATKPPDSDLILNWNLIEAALLFLISIGFFTMMIWSRVSEMYLYAYLHTFLLGLLSVVALAEFVWQNTALKRLDETCRRRYWENYKDSIF